MSDDRPIELDTAFDVVRFKDGAATAETIRVATEVPLTIVANEVEVATLLCSPSHIEELVCGFLFTQGLIGAIEDVAEVLVDEARWRADATIARTPDLELLGKRLYTSGCGKGVQYTSVYELATRRPLETNFRIASKVIDELMRWLRSSSDVHRATGGVHSAALAAEGQLPPTHNDDVGRHNAVDKVIGRSLLDKTAFASSILATTGRVSSEILFKARRCAIPVAASFGAPTHQAVLLARDMGVTLVGFARGSRLTAFSCPERIVP